MSSRIKKNRHQINIDLKNSNRLQFFSPANFWLFRVVNNFITKYISGKVIDLGCGEMPFREDILKKTSHYDTLDIEERTGGVTFIGDVQKLDFIEANLYDGALILEVLEHVPHPQTAIREIHRILKTGGMLILSVPHLSWLHEEPHDYFRFTSYGLKVLLEETGFEIMELQTAGGLFSFLGHQISFMLLCPIWHIRLLRWTVYYLNKWLCVYPCFYFDRYVFGGRRNKFPLGYVVAARKR
jgi:SAM-dependent methyltransferase